MKASPSVLSVIFKVAFIPNLPSLNRLIKLGTQITGQNILESFVTSCLQEWLVLFKNDNGSMSDDA